MVTAAAPAVSLSWPVTAPVTQDYGVRNGHDGGSGHPGIDLGARQGTPVANPAAGTVELAAWNDGYGNCVIVNHGQGVTTLHGHLSAISVAKGQTVPRGAELGKVGTTGFSTGPHLHYEVKVNGQRVNPRSLTAGDPTTTRTAVVDPGGLAIALPDPGAVIGGAASAAVNATPLGALWAKLNDGKTWVRVAQVVGGYIVIGLGLLLLARDLWAPAAAQAGKGAVQTAGKAVVKSAVKAAAVAAL